MANRRIVMSGFEPALHGYRAELGADLLERASTAWREEDPSVALEPWLGRLRASTRALGLAWCALDGQPPAVEALKKLSPEQAASLGPLLRVPELAQPVAEALHAARAIEVEPLVLSLLRRPPRVAPDWVVFVYELLGIHERQVDISARTYPDADRATVSASTIAPVLSAELRDAVLERIASGPPELCDALLFQLRNVEPRERQVLDVLFERAKSGELIPLDTYLQLIHPVETPDQKPRLLVLLALLPERKGRLLARLAAFGDTRALAEHDFAQREQWMDTVDALSACGKAGESILISRLADAREELELRQLILTRFRELRRDAIVKRFEEQLTRTQQR